MCATIACMKQLEYALIEGIYQSSHAAFHSSNLSSNVIYIFHLILFRLT